VFRDAGVIEDQDMGLVYKAVIELNQETLSIGSMVKQLEPGLSVTAEIKAGKKWYYVIC